MGGEKFAWFTTPLLYSGSPPRGRGKVFCVALCIDFLGITPAWAGKSKIWNEWFRDEKDHPRVGGEKFETLPLEIRNKGSPPRGRGKGFVILGKPEPLWITPAWAGKSSRPLNAACFAWDHPRVGGEKTKKIP